MSKCKKTCKKAGDVYLAKVESVYSNSQCPDEVDVEFDTPFFDLTQANKFITIPVKGDEFVIYVPSTKRWAVGQWIHIEGIGKYAITSIINDEQLVLTNGRDTPPAGSQYAGSRKIWITEPSIAEGDADIAGVESVLLSEDFDFCAYTQLATEQEQAHPIGGLTTSDVCVPCNSTVTDDKAFCFRYFKNIVFKWFTIALPAISRTALSVATFVRSGQSVSLPLQEILWHPEEGDLYRRDLPTTNAVDTYDQNSKSYALVPSDYANRFYVLGPNESTGKPEWRNFNEPIAKYIGSNMALGSVNIKNIVETALGIILPTSGQIQISIWAQIEATGAASLAKVDATAGGVVITSARNYDNFSTGTRIVNVNLAAPTVTLAGTGATFNLQQAFIPASMLLN